MFGVLTMHLARLVNHGHSFEGAKDFFNILSNFPLQHSFFHLFQPQRNCICLPELMTGMSLSNFHFTHYDRDNKIVKGYYHSLYGTDIVFECNNRQGLKKVPKNQLKGKKGKKGKQGKTQIGRQKYCNEYPISCFFYLTNLSILYRIFELF